jgi:3-oxoacyl-[acyl-carrier protein] reductase
MFGISGRTAIVTGASAGLGRGIALKFASEGVAVLGVARREELLSSLEEESAREGWARISTIAVDLTDAGSTETIFAAARSSLGHVDILVNNAGASRPSDWDAPESEWLWSMELNFHSHRRLAQAVIPGMKDRGWGRIINITGSHEPRGVNTATPAKAAVHMWSKALSRAVAGDGITINSLAPGRIHSEQIDHLLHPTKESRDAFIERFIPAGRMGQPEELAAMVAFLSSDMAGFITGVVIDVDGGMSLYAY